MAGRAIGGEAMRKYITVEAEVDLSDYADEIREALSEEAHDEGKLVSVEDLYREFNLFGKQALLNMVEDLLYQSSGVRVTLSD